MEVAWPEWLGGGATVYQIHYGTHDVPLPSVQPHFIPPALYPAASLIPTNCHSPLLFAPFASSALSSVSLPNPPEFFPPPAPCCPALPPSQLQ